MEELVLLLGLKILEVQAVAIKEIVLLHILVLIYWVALRILAICSVKVETVEFLIAIIRMVLKEQLVEVLSTLTPREEKVIRLRFGLDDGRPRTLEEVGRDFGVTRERVRQIEAKAIRKLHSRKCLALLNGLIE